MSDIPSELYHSILNRGPDYIPSELYPSILIRVPAEYLLSLKGVCKSWREIIDHPAFIKSHINHHQSSSTSLGQLLIKHDCGGKLFSLSLDSLPNLVDYPQQFTIEAMPIKNLVCRGVPRLTKVPVASCNGIILLSNPKGILVLWNPLRKEFYDLPNYEYDSDNFLCIKGCGLGYDCANDDYKVVRIDIVNRDGELVCKTLIYSLKCDSWKLGKHCPSDCIDWLCQGVYHNGALYWKSWNIIVVLDLSTENYSQLLLPFERPESFEWQDCDMHLDALGGCLVLSIHYREERFDGWVMKDDGREISWIKLFSCKKFDDIGIRRRLRPITYSKSDRRVLLKRDHDFFWLNTDDNCAKKVQIHNFPCGYSDIFSCQVWHGSLFRLKDIVDARRIERVNKRRATAKKRLVLEVTTAEQIWPK